ncbi:hypothetical protein H2248_004293 [Termitomyces sp. 'cryptogamus']|nr:hypothetical protein H2248_004293 [Termitomyces sp. 'cryptogamus']
MFCLLQATAWAKRSQSQAAIGGLGSAQCWSEPEPPQARPKPGLLGQAGPEHHCGLQVLFDDVSRHSMRVATHKR